MNTTSQIEAINPTIIIETPVKNWCGICLQRAYVERIGNGCDKYNCGDCGEFIVDEEAAKLLYSIRDNHKSQSEFVVNLRYWLLQNNEKISVNTINEITKWRRKTINEKSIILLNEIEKITTWTYFTT
jgi:hypothetical protein